MIISNLKHVILEGMSANCHEDMTEKGGRMSLDE